MAEREPCLLSRAHALTSKELGFRLFEEIKWKRPSKEEYEEICRPIYSQKSYSIKGGVIKVGKKEAKVYKCHFYKCRFAAMSLMTPEFKRQYQQETGKSGAFLWHPDHAYITKEDHDHIEHFEEAGNVEVVIKNIFKTRDAVFDNKG